VPTEKDGIGHHCFGVVGIHARSERAARHVAADLQAPIQ
jgi:hypothetical protein